MDNQSTACGRSDSRSSAGSSAKILVVDDDPHMREALARVLLLKGHETTAARDGDEALQMLDGSLFDVALVDVVMPGILGPELIPLLCAKQPSLQVIMMSGSSTIETAVRSLQSGAMDFIEKPIATQVVLRAVERALRNVELGKAAALYKSSQTIFDAQHFEHLPEAIVNVAMQVMSADRASLLLPAMDGNLYVAHAYGLDAEVQNNARIAMGEGIAGRVAASGKPTIINGSASAMSQFVDAIAREQVKSSIIYPLVSGSRLVGVLTFNRLSNDRPYRRADIDQASVLASQVMLALENLRLARQTAISEKLAAVGQLAAGIAHEINTPIQFVGDGLHFLGSALEDLTKLVTVYKRAASEWRSGQDASATLREADALEEEVDVADLCEEVPRALKQTTEGIARVASIVRSIKAFGRPDANTKEPTDIAKLVDATLTVARGEYKYIADVETHFEELPLVLAHPGELGQVVLNIVVNAAHAIADALKAKSSSDRGKITIRGWADGDFVVLSIADTGSGIPKEIQAKIFDPFFTTKPVGRGTGLGLSIARGIVVDKHGGDLTVESEVGVGSRFLIRLRVSGADG
ncbi:MAG TPA: response regulator [Polyangiaceae bacterium]|nr:response regulator [Polyangiaceae bacterium]